MGKESIDSGGTAWAWKAMAGLAALAGLTGGGTALYYKGRASTLASEEVRLSSIALEREKVQLEQDLLDFAQEQTRAAAARQNQAKPVEPPNVHDNEASTDFFHNMSANEQLMMAIAVLLVVGLAIAVILTILLNDDDY